MSFRNSIILNAFLALFGAAAALAGGKSGVPVMFETNMFCGYWNILPIGISSHVEFGPSCKKAKVGKLDLFEGDCDLSFSEGTYQLNVHGAQNEVIFNVDASANVSVHSPYDGLFATGGLGELTLNLIDVTFARNGYKGTIWFEGTNIRSENTECQSDAFALPVGSQWQVGFGPYLHSWVSFDFAGYLHVDAKYGVYKDRKNHSEKAKLTLNPVPVLITPLKESVETPWLVAGVEDNPVVKGTRVVNLIPGMKYQIATMSGSSTVHFINPCEMLPTFAADTLTGTGGFFLQPKCATNLDPETNPISIESSEPQRTFTVADH